MAYTPELSSESACTLRRIAWALNMPMTRTIQEVFSYLPQIMDGQMVCQACRDKTRCADCSFSSNHSKEVIPNK